MSTVLEKLAVGQPAFSTATQEGDYVVDYPLGPQQPDALVIRARYKQFRANYTRPAANSNITYGAATAYFVDDTNFTDERGGVTSWDRTWATVPSAWSEPGGTLAYTFPAYLAGVAFGTIFTATDITASGANYVINTNATNISVSESVLLDLNYVRSIANFHVTFVQPVIAAASGTSITVPSVLPGTGTFSNVSGTVREWSTGRAQPTTIEVDSILIHEYALSSETTLDADLPQIDKFSPVASTGYETDSLSAGTATTPNSATYASMVAAEQYIVAKRSDRTRYLGNIFERVTTLVKAR